MRYHRFLEMQELQVHRIQRNIRSPWRFVPLPHGRPAAAGPAARPCLIWAIGDESAGPAAFTVGETYLVPFAGDQLRNGASLSHPVAANYFGLDQRRAPNWPLHYLSSYCLPVIWLCMALQVQEKL